MGFVLDSVTVLSNVDRVNGYYLFTVLLMLRLLAISLRACKWRCVVAGIRSQKDPNLRQYINKISSNILRMNVWSLSIDWTTRFSSLSFTLCFMLLFYSAVHEEKRAKSRV